MSPSTYKRILFNERPEGEITSTTFRLDVVPFDLKPGAGEALVQITYLSLDAAMRAWMKPTSTYMAPLQEGDVMRSGGLGVVIEVGEGSKLSVGDLVYGAVGWREYGVYKDAELTVHKVPPGAEALDFLGALGLTGLTAYFGLTDIGKLKAGETLVVSGAAGATGSLVCQIGKILGARVIAIAGSADKCHYLETELGVEKALNYKDADFKTQFKQTLKGGLDVYFDNVGGEILDLCLTRLNMYARVVMCGAISEYNGKPKGLQNYLTVISQRATLQGFIIFDYAKQFHVGLAEIGKWLAEGKLKRKFHVVEGLEKAPEALPMLYSGGNTGKLVVKVADAVGSKL
ncbi:hypothetical protein BXZ70DRAFT_1010733 [Cristinia sonorae]|uniref:Enoyl reductase (ER) domain-containing protein n=1 Tax=Cristinia sonorae TaxID=1940300 RepID=A0A8K0UJA7_9AGAR|nr:hypothetical protein BXZ70DRAFT_1010733 [Cristinia sonorae]